MLQLKPLNKCRELNPVTTGFAHSKGEPDVSPMTSNISVRFAPISQWEPGIRQLTNKKNVESTVDMRMPLTLANPSTTGR